MFSWEETLFCPFTNIFENLKFDEVYSGKERHKMHIRAYNLSDLEVSELPGPSL